MATCSNLIRPMSAKKSKSGMLRTAFDPSGRPGSLYDGRRDRISNCSRVNLPTEWLPYNELIMCDVCKFEMEKSPNLFKYCSGDKELQLSLSLQMAPTTGMGALINYTRPIDKYTYLLKCNWRSQTECLSDDTFQSLCGNIPTISDQQVTHIIISVNWGVDCGIFLQLPPDDQLADKLQVVIEKLCVSIRDEHSNSIMMPDEMSMLAKIVHIEAFSNIPDLCQVKSMTDFYHRISRIKEDKNLHKPYNYYLYPIQRFYAFNICPETIFQELQQNSIQKLQKCLFPLVLYFKRLTAMLDHDYPNLERFLKEYLYKTRAECSTLKATYTDRIQGLQDLIIVMRRTTSNENKIDMVLNSQGMQDLGKTMKKLSDRTTGIQQKEHLIKDLVEKRFLYRDGSDYNIKQDVDDATLESKLLKNHDKHVRIVCFDNTLYETNKSQWYNLHEQLIKERDENPQLQIIYVDFSYGKYRPKRIMVLPSIEKRHNIEAARSSASSSSARVRQYRSINILLLGESGAGKSTFINALANYLIYDTLREAERKPTVLIPVSFIMTVGVDFQECQVKFGGMDTLSNEVHDCSTQSVTQHCKSYVFTLKENDGQRVKLRIIDTPGIGDVRGTAQDDINMQHILSYMNNLTHLDAVCILMKPNNARLNVFFRSCLIQLFDLLGENARDRIVFCFTNARSTFYTPGNTGPLLKEFLKTLPVRDIPFKKTNTFCFDSESFRYLIAKLNRITFKSDEEKDYQESWERSSAESKRFLEHIRKNIPESYVFGERQSIKDAQLKINLLIRPILETIRNTCRNIICHDTLPPNESIILSPRIVKCTTAICLECPRESVKCAGFWITRDELHVFHNKCRTCKCDPNRHYPIDYQLEYESCQQSTGVLIDDLKGMRNDLRQASAEFAHFLAQATNSSHDDLFLTGFERMIKEEEDVRTKQPPCERNKWLPTDLEKQKKNYEAMRQKLTNRNEDIPLPHIYDRIRDISKYSEIKSQMAAVQEWRKFMIRYYEYEVPV